MTPYKLETNKINGIAIPVSGVILTTDYEKVTIRFQGDVVPFIETTLENFVDDEDTRFESIDALITYFNSNYNL